MALTATATPRVRRDIIHQLDMRQPKWSVTVHRGWSHNFFVHTVLEHFRSCPTLFSLPLFSCSLTFCVDSYNVMMSLSSHEVVYGKTKKKSTKNLLFLLFSGHIWARVFKLCVVITFVELYNFTPVLVMFYFISYLREIFNLFFFLGPPKRGGGISFSNFAWFQDLSNFAWSYNNLIEPYSLIHVPVLVRLIKVNFRFIAAWKKWSLKLCFVSRFVSNRVKNFFDCCW